MCSESSISAAVEKVKTEYKELYGLINNAGGALEKANQTVELNTYAPIKVSEAFLPLLQKDGGKKGNVIFRIFVLMIVNN